MNLRQLVIHARLDIAGIASGNLGGKPFQIPAGHEMVATAAQDHHARVVIGRCAGGCRFQRDDHFPVQCVERLRPVHRQDGNAIGKLVADKGHENLRYLVCRVDDLAADTEWYRQTPSCLRFP